MPHITVKYYTQPYLQSTGATKKNKIIVLYVKKKCYFCKL